MSSCEVCHNYYWEETFYCIFSKRYLQSAYMRTTHLGCFGVLLDAPHHCKAISSPTSVHHLVFSHHRRQQSATSSTVDNRTGFGTTHSTKPRLVFTALQSHCIAFVLVSQQRYQIMRSRNSLLLVVVAVVTVGTSNALVTPSRHALATGKSTVTKTRLGNDTGAAAAAAEPPRGGAKESGGTATIPNEVFNLIKSIVGAGVLSLPAGTSP
jgi:hypothetical protein